MEKELVEAAAVELAAKKKQLAEQSKVLTKRCGRCQKTVHVTESYRCYYCQGWFCPEDAGPHFSEHMKEESQ